MSWHNIKSSTILHMYKKREICGYCVKILTMACFRKSLGLHVYACLQEGMSICLLISLSIGPSVLNLFLWTHEEKCFHISAGFVFQFLFHKLSFTLLYHLSFTIFLSQSFPHNLLFIIFSSQTFFHNHLFTTFMTLGTTFPHQKKHI